MATAMKYKPSSTELLCNKSEGEEEWIFFDPICVFNKLKGEEINLFLICAFALRKLDT